MLKHSHSVILKVSFVVFLVSSLMILWPVIASPGHAAAGANFPPTILWAWERPEDLRFIDPNAVGVAFLAKTLRLRGDRVDTYSRRQLLRVPPDTMLIAVTRIETRLDEAAAITPQQHAQLVSEIADVARLPGISGVQVDFDARASQRGWYGVLLKDLRRTLPDSTSLSITALASWCLYDRWVSGLPIDEAVPMLFRMGPEGTQIRQYLASHRDFGLAVCRASAGISTDEPLPVLPPHRRHYIFAPQPWTEATLRRVAATEGMQ